MIYDGGVIATVDVDDFPCHKGSRTYRTIVEATVIVVNVDGQLFVALRSKVSGARGYPVQLIRRAMITSISYTLSMPAARFGVIRRNLRGSGVLGMAGHHPRDILHSYAELVLTNTLSRQGLHLIMLVTQRTHYAVSFTTLRSAWCAHRSCDARLSIFRAALR